MANQKIKCNPEAWKAYQKWLSDSIAQEKKDELREHWLGQSIIIAHKNDRRTKNVRKHSRTG